MKHFKYAYMSIKINIGQILIFVFYMKLLTIISVYSLQDILLIWYIQFHSGLSHCNSTPVQHTEGWRNLIFIFPSESLFQQILVSVCEKPLLNLCKN